MGDASCYTGILGGSIAALAGADICITCVGHRKDAGVVFLSGVLRNHRLVGFMTKARATPTGARAGCNYITVGAGSAPSTATSDHYS